MQYRMLSCAEGDAVAECSDAVRTGMSLQTLLCTYIITQNCTRYLFADPDERDERWMELDCGGRLSVCLAGRLARSM